MNDDDRESQVYSEQLHRIAFDHSPTGMVYVGVDGRFIKVNSAMCEIAGYCAEELVGMAVSNLTHPDDRARDAELLEPFLRGSMPTYENEKRYVRKDGNVSWVTVTARMVTDAQGRPLHTVGVVLDTTARKLAEAQLQRNTGILQAICEVSPDLIFVKDQDGRLVFANPATLRVIGLPEKDVIGTTEIERVPSASIKSEAEAEVIMANDRRIMAAGVTETIEEEFSGPSGKHVYQSVKTPMRDGGGAVCGIAGISRDITDQKRVQSNLRERQDFISGILGSITDGFGVVCKDWRFTFANDELVRRIGKQRDEILGNAMWDMFPDAVGNHAYVQLHRAMAERVAVEYEVYYEPWQRWMLEKAFPTADGGLAVYTQDITERKRTEEMLRQSEANAQTRTAELESLLAAAPLGMAYFDRQHRYVRINDELAEINGIPAAAHIGKTIEELLPKNAETVTPVLDRIFETGEVVNNLEVTGETPREPRVVRHWLTGFFPVRDVRGEVTSVGAWVTEISEKKRAEDRLSESEARFRAAVGAVSSLIWTNNASGEMEGEQPGWAKFTGQSLEEYQGYGWASAVHPEDAQPTIDGWNQAVAEKRMFEGEHRLRRNDGEWRLCSIRAVPVLGEAGEIREWVGVHTDITERKATEEALRKSEERLQKAISVQNVGVLFFKLDGHMLDANGALQRMSGYTAEELHSITDWAQLTPPEFMDVTRRAAAELAERGVTAPYEKQWIRKDGSRFWGLFSPTRLSGSGSESECVEFTIDITERKRAEETLRESEARLGGILRRSPAGIVQTDAAGCMTLVNPRWCELLGYPEAELLGRNIIDITHPSFVAPTVAAFGRLAAGGPDFQIEKAYSHKDGSVLSAQSNVAALRSPNGEFLGLIAVVLDISERLRADEELRRLAAELSEADRRKDVFLATLAHELRNPLAPIRNGLQVMKLARNNVAAVEQVRAMMERQVVQLVRLVDDLLDVSRITQGKVELRKKRIALKAVIEAAVETSRSAIEQAGHGFTVVVPDEPIFVDADAARLAQVVSNLLNNSAKYTHRGGHVRLTAWCEDGTAVLSVKDDGIGIPPAMLGRVFDMFVQVDRGLEKTTGGLGIGLSLVKGLTELHGGTVEATSAGEGMGSEFLIRLPVAINVVAGPDRPNGQTIDIVPGTLRRILIVDDNVDAAETLGQLLEMFGNEVRTANDGEAGIAVAAQFRPDLVFMDIGMPTLNGYEAARRIRQQPWGREMVLVALTGWGQEDDRKKSANAGFDHHLVKPVEMEALMKLMAR